jgi:DNA polymerase-3 subunit chi
VAALVDFYHLASSPIERVLPQICDKVLGLGERLLVVAEPHLLRQLDAQLWSYAPDAFLPHGLSDGPTPEAQPVLLSSTPDPQNGATNLALPDGQWREEGLGFARTFYFFDAANIDQARAAWRALQANELAQCRYWKQDERGNWVQGP